MSALPLGLEAVAGLPPELAGSQAAQAVRTLRSLPGPLVVCDMYDPRGADTYHDFTMGDTSEVAEIVREVRRTSGTVLELAAGAGRLTVPLLSLRRDLIAVDLSPSMLALLRERLGRLPRAAAERCEVVHGDITTYTAPRPVGVAVLGTTSVSLLTREQRQAMLRRTWEALEPGGLFVLTTVQLDPAAVALDERVLDAAGMSGRVYRVYDLVAPDRCGRYTVVISTDDEHGRTVCHSYIRLVPAQELVADLEAAGFTVGCSALPAAPGERYAGMLLRAVKEAR